MTRPGSSSGEAMLVEEFRKFAQHEAVTAEIFHKLFMRQSRQKLLFVTS